VVLLLTLSCCCFGTVLFLIDLLHFTHIFVGLLFFCGLCTRLFLFVVVDTRCLVLFMVILY